MFLNNSCIKKKPQKAKETQSRWKERIKIKADIDEIEKKTYNRKN